MAEEIHSRNLGVRIGGPSCITLSVASKMEMASISYTLSIYVPIFSDTGDAEVVDVLSG